MADPPKHKQYHFRWECLMKMIIERISILIRQILLWGNDCRWCLRCILSNHSGWGACWSQGRMLWACSRTWKRSVVFSKLNQFYEIYDVQFVLYSHLAASYWKVKPLVIAVCIRIVLNKQTISISLLFMFICA